MTWVAQFFPLITGIGFIIFGVIMGLVKKWQPVLFAVSFTIGVGLTAGGILLFWVLSKRRFVTLAVTNYRIINKATQGFDSCCYIINLLFSLTFIPQLHFKL